MPDITPDNLVRLERALNSLGLSLPTSAAAIGETHRAALATATDTSTATLAADILAGSVAPGEVSDRVRSAARALVERDAVRRVLYDVSNAFNKATAQWFRDHGEEIIIEIQPVFTAEAAKLAKALEVLDGQANPADVLAAGAKAAKAWNDRSAAIATLRQCHDVRKQLARGGYGPRVEDVAWWVTDVRTSADLARADALLDRSRWAIEAVVAAGFTVAMNTAVQAATVTHDAAAGTAAARAIEQSHDPRVQAWNRRREAEARRLREAIA